MSYKPIRNKIGGFTLDSLVYQLRLILSDMDCSHEWKKYAFWHSLLLLKWTLEFAGRRRKLKVAMRHDVVNLLEEIQDLELNHPAFRTSVGSGKLHKMLTIVSPQQFHYQDTVWWDSFATQYLLYEELKHKYDIAAAFEKLTGLRPEIFIQVLSLFWVTLLKHRHFPGEAIFPLPAVIDHLRDFYGREVLGKVLKLFTVSEENIREVLDEDSRGLRNYDLQVFETSFFTRRPLLLHQGKLSVPFRGIFHTTANHFIYEFMKHKDDQFSSELGYRMEKYVKLGLDELKRSYLTENEIAKKIGTGKNLVDFFVDDAIFIEVKAIELRPYTAINPEDELLAIELRKNIVKAYAKQILGVAEELSKKGAEYFGLIVTYKELYLGNGNDLWDQFLQEETETLRSSAQISIVPPSNLYLIDLRGWNLLIQVCKTTGRSPLEILKKAKADDSVGATKKFTMTMHLEGYGIRVRDVSYIQRVKGKVTPITDPPGAVAARSL